MKEHPKVNCHICGEQDEARFTEPTKSRMINEKLCFSCLFWVEKTDPKIRDSMNTARIEGRHYIIRPETDAPAHCRGHSGRYFVIRFFDGRMVPTTNLWSQGSIPEEFKDLLPDNAEFVK